MNKKAYFVAGGTAGHINSALALGEFFKKKGYESHYISGNRHLDLKLFSKIPCIHFGAKALIGQSFFNRLISLLSNMLIFFKAFILFLKDRPSFVIGAGGYVCGPVLMAAYCLKVPIYVLEQNAIMGFTNKVLVRFAKKIFTHFKETVGLSLKYKKKVVVSGNPIRSSISSLSRSLHSPQNEQNKEDKIVIFGGSMGAKSINELVEGFIKKDQERHINIIHQVGAGNAFLVNPLALGKNVQYEQREYLDDIASIYDWADVVICRSGASSVAELRYVGKPVIFIPYPLHADRQQFINAEHLREEVSFPVYIEKVEDLAANDYEKLQEILEKVRKYVYVGSDAKYSPEHACALVYEEINKDVVH